MRNAMAAGALGQIVTPAAGNAVGAGFEWVADNAVFADRYPGDDAYLAWLETRLEHQANCRFVVAPDVVGDAAATLARSAPMLPRLRAAGWPVALVLQDGQEHLPMPWDLIDAVFVGGSTEWKLSQAARGLVAEARRRGKWVHMGRVNSLRRLRYAEAIGCDSVDGTYLAFGPDRNLPRLLGWLGELDRQPALWEVA